MADARFLIVRLGSMGDIVHALPGLAALRQAFPAAQLDWVVERKWASLLEACPDLSHVVIQDRASPGAFFRLARELRAQRYDCVVDFQGLYKSAALAFFSAAPRRIGLAREFAREGGAALFYTERVRPDGAHVVEWSLSLARAAGAAAVAARFPLHVSAEAEASVAEQVTARGLAEFYVISPGGGWRSKCWPAEHYGHLHRKLAERYGWRAVVSYGPRERALAEAVRRVAGEPEPVVLELNLADLVALLRRAKFLVAGDSGPLHVAAALGTPVIGLYGPTDPARNGPYGQLEYVVRNARPEDTTYHRGRQYSPAMLAIRVDQVVDAVERRMGVSQ